PSKMSAPVKITAPSPISAAGSGSRGAVERGESTGCLPTTAYSSTFTPAPRTVPSWTIAVGWTSATQRIGQLLERAHDHRAVARDLPPVALARDQAEEVLALEPQGLGGLDLRDVDVAGAG